MSGEGRGQEGTTEPYITGVQSAKEANKEHKRKTRKKGFSINRYFKKKTKTWFSLWFNNVRKLMFRLE